MREFSYAAAVRVVSDRRAMVQDAASSSSPLLTNLISCPFLTPCHTATLLGPPVIPQYPLLHFSLHVTCSPWPSPSAAPKMLDDRLRGSTPSCSRNSRSRLVHMNFLLETVIAHPAKTPRMIGWKRAAYMDGTSRSTHLASALARRRIPDANSVSRQEIASTTTTRSPASTIATRSPD